MIVWIWRTIRTTVRSVGAVFLRGSWSRGADAAFLGGDRRSDLWCNAVRWDEVVRYIFDEDALALGIKCQYLKLWLSRGVSRLAGDGATEAKPLHNLDNIHLVPHAPDDRRSFCRSSSRIQSPCGSPRHSQNESLDARVWELDQNPVVHIFLGPTRSRKHRQMVHAHRPDLSES
jgi:hypothetical protein